MCGFFLEISPSLLPESQFLALLNKSRKRGPDSQGIWSENSIRMGFNRLAILELSKVGNQPMISFSGRWVICFNGEIYNHLELRKHLGLGQDLWQGSSDTETILAGIDAWGVEATMSKLDGMFAISLWDRLEQKLYLIRDFAGIKPLWVGQKGQVLVASSQYDQIAGHPAFKDENIQPEVLVLYLEQHYIPAPFGLHEFTSQLEPGEIRCFSSDGKVTTSFFWRLPEIIETVNLDPQECLQRLSDNLESSVKNEMLADVPLGAFLSGGVDSPLIAHYANLSFNDSVKTFNIGSDSIVHDESEDAATYARLIGSDHTFRKMNASSALQIIDIVMQSMHEPMADFSIIPTWLVSQLSKEQVTVALSGDGADELFFGYERFESISKNYPFFDFPHFIKYGFYGMDKVLAGNKHINSNLLFTTPGMAHQKLHSRFSINWRNRLFPDLNNINNPESFQTYNYQYSSKQELLHKMRKAEFYGMMQKTLRKVDLASMEHSLEVRVPFLQKSFIESSLQIPINYNFSQGKKKQMLKNLLKTRMPLSPIDERKRGFSIPLTKWIREDLYDYFSDNLLNQNFVQKYGINRSSIECMLEEHKQGKSDHKWPLFTMLALCSFEKMKIEY